jgi:hypothetical protein
VESGFVLFVKGFTALIEEHVSQLLVRYAGLLRRSNVGTRSILAAIKH